MRRSTPLLTALLLAALSSSAQLRLAKIFGSGMVLQQNAPTPVWGWAKAGEKITVSFADQKKSVRADKNGKWMLRLEPLPAGGPFSLELTGEDNAANILKDVYVGEVWVCSGQSNMEWDVRSAANAENEIKEANYPTIRHIKIESDLALSPKEDIERTSGWQVCSPATVGGFSAVGYFFARELQKKLKVPVGLINNAWGGSQLESWLSKEAMLTHPDLIKPANELPADFETLTQQIETKIKQQYTHADVKTPADEVLFFTSPFLDESKWKTFGVPGSWEWQNNLTGFTGTVWFRKTFELSDKKNLDNFKLGLGVVNSTDQTYLNGTLIGSTTGETKRLYDVPKGLLKVGKNVIATRVSCDRDWIGGINGNRQDVFLRNDAVNIPLHGDWKGAVSVTAPMKIILHHNNAGTLLFNAMLAPLIPYAIQGVLWYQGEANAGRAFQYRSSFPLLIKDWRKHWAQGDFPFLYAQLSSFDAGGGNSKKGSGWAELREAQAFTLALPNTGMAVTTDIGESGDIHPKNKLDVGKRLAMPALALSYGLNVPYSGPTYNSVRTYNNKAELQFDYAASGLMAKGNTLGGFEVAGADKVFYAAKADIVANKVVVSSERVPKILSVRYNWADDAKEGNLYNRDGLPAAPFRTDGWATTTERNKFQ